MAAFRGSGSTIAVGDGASPEVFTAIGQVINISGPDRQNPEINVTNLSSTAQEFIADLKDNGTVTFGAHYDSSSAQHQGLQTDFDADPPTTKKYRITVNDPANSPRPTITFAAFVQSMPLDVPANESVKINVTLRITGAVTFVY